MGVNTQLKTCTRCGIDQPLSHFYKHRDMKDGHLNQCKECSRIYTKNRYRNNRLREGKELQSHSNRIEIQEDGTALVELTQGQYARIDARDVPLISSIRWTATRRRHSWYAYTKVRGSQENFFMHWAIIGKPEDGMEVDHINSDGLDNRRSNLRMATTTQNHANMRLRSDNKSGFKGVSFDPQKGKFAARIYHLGKLHWLGRYDTAESAALAYDEAARNIFGEFARLNFPGNMNV